MEENKDGIDTKYKNPIEDISHQNAIALRESKSLTPRIYHYLGDIFRHMYGERAGWAHSLLFAAELPAYRKLLPSEMQKEMNDYRELEKQERIEKKLAKAQTTAPSKNHKNKKTGPIEKKGKALTLKKGKKDTETTASSGKRRIRSSSKATSQTLSKESKKRKR